MTRAVQVTVLGGGSWGTTVAALAAGNATTTLWARDADVAREIDEQHTNARFLGEERVLPQTLRATGDVVEAASGADVLVVGVPSVAVREVLRQAAPHVRPWIPVLSLVKGLEPDTRKRISEVIISELPGHPVGVLAGPNLAREVLDGFAAATVIATPDDAVGRALQPLFAGPRFRVYRNQDVLGSELGGVLKNVIAIAVGMAEGLGVGDNTRAMVIARGLAEMTRLGEAMGADPRTFAGLTGLGDLMATCMSPLSRNRRVGEELARGRTLEQIASDMNQVAEGVKTARTVMELADQHGVVMPIAAEVDAVVNEGRHPADAYRGLQRMAAGSEHHAVA
ncbi:MAG TPA: NAD(P)H-dependent glycerol-3-phosphate dehydrogenase [Solirubrobacteraceae bacterium]|jgi:glycerol-3-phosphate dehydrogenase (NAD(P)+)|nr:NAD(P)H-dependent glycerol-3-phosphate dehydrogenase [Solirubrobacteraceae bacterium]